MKRFFLLLSFLLGIFSPIASFAESNRSITILYTGSVNGTIDYIIGCACSPGSSGGLARRAHMIESIRKDKRSVLLLDCGEAFGTQSDNAELHLKAMERMGYDALNLGVPELSLGKSFLDRTYSQVSFPYIASNLLYDGGRLPWFREYVIKEVDGIKVGILGILDPDDFKKISRHDDLKGFKIISPEDALNKLLPEIREKVDLVILLSQSGEFGEQKIFSLLKAIRGIDVPIFSERNYVIKPPAKNVIALRTATNGKTLGLVTITLDDKGARSVSERRDVPLDDSVPEDEEILRFVEMYEKDQVIKKENQKKELMEGLRLSPKEYMERYRKDLL